ncbi:MAG: hypothetical protein II776_05335, partial [Clostridia bacterium]|nr:hypothetical protein [Clostridia bacterium]
GNLFLKNGPALSRRFSFRLEHGARRSLLCSAGRTPVSAKPEDHAGDGPAYGDLYGSSSSYGPDGHGNFSVGTEIRSPGKGCFQPCVRGCVPFLAEASLASSRRRRRRVRLRKRYVKTTHSFKKRLHFCGVFFIISAEETRDASFFT